MKSESRPRLLVAPRGAQLLGLAFALLNPLVVRAWRRSEARRLGLVAERLARLARERRGDDVALLGVRLAGLNR